MDLIGKNIVVIGGCGGIGQATSHRLLQKKIANLVIADCCTFLSQLNDLRTEYPDTTISFFHVDITKKEDVERIFGRIKQKIQNIDVVLNAAGVLDDSKPELTVNVNLGDYYYAKSGVALTVICPRFTNTPLTENLTGKPTFPYDYNVFGQRSLKSQSAEDCAENLVKDIEKNKNGSIWVCDGGELNEINLKDSCGPRS